MTTTPAVPTAGLRQLVAVNPVGCWLWQGRIDTDGRGAGYGRIGRAERAHLMVYTLLVGPVGRGLELDHVCRTRSCVNPEHLEPVTRAENMSRLRPATCARGHRIAGTNAEPNGRRNAAGERSGRTCRTCRLTRRRANRAAGRNA